MLWVGVGAEAAWAGQVLSRRPDGGVWFQLFGQPALQAVATCGPGLAFVESQEVQRTPLEVFVTCKVKNGTKLTHEAKVGGGVQRRRYPWLHR